MDLSASRKKHLAKIPFPIHNNIHHGLSSQALLINLLGPLIVDEQWEKFDKILKRAKLSLNGKISGVDLEYTNRSVFHEQGATDFLRPGV